MLSKLHEIQGRKNWVAQKLKPTKFEWLLSLFLLHPLPPVSLFRPLSPPPSQVKYFLNDLLKYSSGSWDIHIVNFPLFVQLLKIQRETWKQNNYDFIKWLA